MTLSLPSSCAGTLLKNESLAQYTSWRTGGLAEYVYHPKDLQDLSCFLQSLPEAMPLTWLGLGSNTLIRDGGVEGVVIITQVGLQSLSVLHSVHDHDVLQTRNGQNTSLIRAEAGVSAAKLARYSARISVAGLEFMAGIPGTVGGALAMNAGCFGGETWQYVQSVETIDRFGTLKQRSLEDFQINYRHVVRPQDEWFVAGYFSLMPGDKEQSLQKIRDLLAKRNDTQPAGTANCGSVFRNPPGDYAGRLIESHGLKGYRLGGAVVSEKHANFIINDQNASAGDIEALIDRVRAIVYEKTGVRLVAEVCILGKM